jgi:hypothetical protein
MSVTPEGFIARDALIRCEAMAAYAVSARESVEAHDVARLGHAIAGMRLTLEDLAQYHDAALSPVNALIRAEQWLAENGREALDDGIRVVGETVITPSREALALFLAAIDDDESDERGSEG